MRGMGVDIIMPLGIVGTFLLSLKGWDDLLVAGARLIPGDASRLAGICTQPWPPQRTGRTRRETQHQHPEVSGCYAVSGSSSHKVLCGASQFHPGATPTDDEQLLSIRPNC
jgi:hypothetical protein